MRRWLPILMLSAGLGGPAFADEGPTPSEMLTRVRALETELERVNAQIATMAPQGGQTADTGTAKEERSIFALPGANSAQPSPLVRESGWTIGGYGELLITTQFFGLDPNKEYDPASYHDTNVDFARVVILANYDFNRWLSFRTELEFEHGGTGATMEQEWDEFGEYEIEIEKGGEVMLEQAFLEARFGRDFGLPLDLGLRVGHLLVPFGTISYNHLPTLFSATHRPESEEAMIPSTWHETGLEFFLSYKHINFQTQVITGLDSTGFSSNRWIAGGTQQRFEAVKSNDWAFVARLAYSGVAGLTVGTSFYTSNTTQNRPKRDMEAIDARVYLADLHLRYHHGPFRMATQGMMGWLTNADLVTQKNSSLSSALGVPKTSVGSAAYGAFFETSLDLIGVVAPSHRQRFDVFARYDIYDTMWHPPEEDSGFDNPLLQRQVLTAGVNWFPHPRVVLKAEYLSRWVNKDSDWGRRQHEVNFALGFVL